jgi:hypothetical protein
VKGALRIALAYFAATPLLSWISLCGWLMVGGGLLLAAATGSASLATKAVGFAQFGTLAAVLEPLYCGGSWMRNASTPCIMHLRPHGRWQMLFGALLAITVSAVVLALPPTACSYTPAGTEITGSVPFFTVNRDLCGDFGLSAGKQIQLVWGTVALIWVALFTLSSRPLLLAFIWAPLFLAALLWDWLHPQMPYTRQQLAVAVFTAGVATWTAFSLWYLNTSPVLRRNSAAAQIAALGSARPFRRPATHRPAVSRAVAASRYLLDSDALAWHAAGTGAFFALLFVAMDFLPAQMPLTVALMTVAAFPATMAALSVRRARLVWLRAGLDRATLFATTERLALRAFGLFVALPFAAVTTLAVTRNPGLVTPVLLHVGTLLVFAIGAMFAGLMSTRGTLAAFGLFVVGGVPSFLMLASLQPDKVTSPWAHIGTLLLFSATAMWLRGLARRRWVELDWRLTGPAIVQGPR